MDENPEVTRSVEVDPVTGVRREVRTVRERTSITPWVVAGAVAVVAIIAVVWMTNRPTTDQLTSQEAAAAAEQARAQGVVEGAQSTLQATTAASQTSAAMAQSAADQTTRQAQAAAADAHASAERARSASDSASDAADRATVVTPPDTETAPH